MDSSHNLVSSDRNNRYAVRINYCLTCSTEPVIEVESILVLWLTFDQPI